MCRVKTSTAGRVSCLPVSGGGEWGSWAPARHGAVWVTRRRGGPWGMPRARGAGWTPGVGGRLFRLTAGNLVPQWFVKFRGVLDANGNATATVNIPSGLPKLGDMTVFVAGVIYKGSTIIEVTNTHWFVLP